MMGDQRDGLRGGISVGGPSGIHINGSDVEVGGVRAGQMVPEQLATPVVRNDLMRVPAQLVRHSGALLAVSSVGASVLLTGTAVVISLLHLPWLLLAGPGTLSAALVTAALGFFLRARRRVTTGGIDPEVEQRILDLAVTCGGRVTVTAVARALSMPMAAADATLMALARSGHVAVENDPASGVVIYVFPDVDAGLVPIRRSP